MSYAENEKERGREEGSERRKQTILLNEIPWAKHWQPGVTTMTKRNSIQFRQNSYIFQNKSHCENYTNQNHVDVVNILWLNKRRKKKSPQEKLEKFDRRNDIKVTHF